MKNSHPLAPLGRLESLSLVYPSGNETRDAALAIAKHGEIAFVTEFAHQAVKSGEARDPLHALQLGTAEVERVSRARRKVRLARDTLQALDANHPTTNASARLTARLA